MAEENETTGVTIFAPNNLPFPDFEAAAAMRDLLSRESTYMYRVQRYRDSGATQLGSKAASGFVVIRSAGKASSIDNGAADDAGADLDLGSYQAVYHPALRTYLLQAPLILLALIATIAPDAVWHILFSGPPAGLGWVDWPSVIDWTRYVAGGLVLFLVAGVVLSYFASTLIVDGHGVAMKQGIIARDLVHVRFSEIKTVGLKQGVLDRLLNVGLLEFASSGTDDMDIRFYNVANPGRVKKEIQAIIARQATA